MSISPTQGSIFANEECCETIVVKRAGLDLTYMPGFIEPGQADQWFQELLQTISWIQHPVTVYGKRHLTPRLTCWMGDPDLRYHYSNYTMTAEPWSAPVKAIKKLVQAASDESFNSVLLNYYRDGRDSNGWHADDEKELGDRPTIASLSLGAERDFDLRNKQNHNDKIRFSLAHGSLLVMRGETQKSWQHQVPKRANVQARINLTFRTVAPFEP